MKIALIFNKESEGTTGIYIEKALKDSGIEFEHFWTSQSHSIESKFDLYLRIDHGDYKYDISDNLHPAAFWVIDTHLKKPFKKIARQAKHYDFVFCAQKQGAQKLKRRGINAYWLPLGCDPAIHKRLETSKIYNIGFVGTDGKKSLRSRFLQELNERYPDTFLGKAPYSEMGRIYSSSKIGFNYSIKNDINMRMFEIMSCGALLLTNRIKKNGFEELFENGKHLIVYNNQKELFKMIDYYLSHHNERKEIALKGYGLVDSRHTYKIRVKKLLDYVFK